MRNSTRKYLEIILEKLNIIKFQIIEGKLSVYSIPLTNIYFICKHQNWTWSIKKANGNADIILIRNTAKPIRKNANLCNFKALFYGHLNLRI